MAQGELADNERSEAGSVVGLKKRITGVYGTDMD
jgi:hypothetical protein